MFPTRDVPKQEKKRHCAEASPAKGQDDPAQWQEAEWWSKPRLVGLYKGLYYLDIWGLLTNTPWYFFDFWLNMRRAICARVMMFAAVWQIYDLSSLLKDAKANISKPCSHLTVSIHGGSLPLSYEPFIIVDISCLVLSPLLSLGPKVGSWIWGTLAFTGGHGSGCVGLMVSKLLIPWWFVHRPCFFHDFDPMLIPDDFSIRLIWLFTTSWPPLSTSRWSVVEGFWLAMEHHRFWKRSNKSWRRLNAENRWKLVVLSDNFT